MPVKSGHREGARTSSMGLSYSCVILLKKDCLLLSLRTREENIGSPRILRLSLQPDRRSPIGTFSRDAFHVAEEISPRRI